MSETLASDGTSFASCQLHFAQSKTSLVPHPLSTSHHSDPNMYVLPHILLDALASSALTGGSLF